jgi:hypothetical protein
MIHASKTTAIAKIQKQISGIQSINPSELFSKQFKDWRKQSENVLDNIFGNPSRQLKDFLNINYRRGRIGESGSTYDYQTQDLEEFKEGLDRATLTLESFVKEIEEYSQDNNIESNNNSTVGLNEVVDLKPNFMGIGLNINMLIRKFFKKP